MHLSADEFFFEVFFIRSPVHRFPLFNTLQNMRREKRRDGRETEKDRTEAGKERTLKGLRQKIRQHTFGWTILHVNLFTCVGGNR